MCVFCHFEEKNEIKHFFSLTCDTEQSLVYLQQIKLQILFSFLFICTYRPTLAGICHIFEGIGFGKISSN